jgi:RNA methyltransferase, TrmH family
VLTNGETKELRALHTRSNREAKGRFLAEGVRVVEDLIDSPIVVRWAAASSSLEDTGRGAELVASIEARGIPLRRIQDQELAGLAATDTPQGIVAVAETPNFAMGDLPQPTTGRSVVLILDGIQDPGNFGTLVRSAEALGAVGVVALPGTVDPWNAKSVRASAGSSFRVPIVAATWQECRSALREIGYTLLGADTSGDPIDQVAVESVGLVVGNEGGGISPAVREGVDRLVAVPIRGRAESLNVAAAAAILLYELSSSPG